MQSSHYSINWTSRQSFDPSFSQSVTDYHTFFHTFTYSVIHSMNWSNNQFFSQSVSHVVEFPLSRNTYRSTSSAEHQQRIYVQYTMLHEITCQFHHSIHSDLRTSVRGVSIQPFIITLRWGDSRGLVHRTALINHSVIDNHSLTYSLGQLVSTNSTTTHCFA